MIHGFVVVIVINKFAIKKTFLFLCYIFINYLVIEVKLYIDLIFRFIHLSYKLVLLYEITFYILQGIDCNINK